MNDYEELIYLLDRLDDYRSQRRKLLWSVFWYLSGLMLSIGVLSLLRSRLLIPTAVVLLIGCTVIGLLILSNFIKNEVAGRELERDVRNVKLRHQMGVAQAPAKEKNPPKRKRDGSRLAVGDDGELVEIVDEGGNQTAQQGL